MNIPAVIGLGEDLLTKYDGKMAVIDGFTGMLYIDPDEETMKVMEEKRAKDQEQKALLEQLKGKENVTKSGQKINVYANIGNVSDVGAVLKNDGGRYRFVPKRVPVFGKFGFPDRRAAVCSVQTSR